MLAVRTLCATSIALVSLALSACGSSTDEPAAQEGGGSDSGSVGAGASAQGTGGATGTGGAKATGGATGTGGAMGTGGAKATGGATGTGGAGTGGQPGATDGGTGLCGTGSWQVADIPAVGTTGVVYLSDLTETKAETWGTGSVPIGKDKSVTGKALVINDVCYAKGLGVHANARVTYALGGAYKQFLATTGLDFLESSATMIFEVTLDGQLVYDNGQGTKTKDQVAPVSIDVTGKNTMEVYVRDGFDDQSDDFGVWGGARLVK
jgi:endo-alpha-N-acetylgalactosaminidase